MSLDLERLARIIAIAGGSIQDGEAVAAVRQADRTIRAAGLTWHDILKPGQQNNRQNSQQIQDLVDQIRRRTAESQQHAAECHALRQELANLRARPAANTYTFIHTFVLPDWRWRLGKLTKAAMVFGGYIGICLVVSTLTKLDPPVPLAPPEFPACTPKPADAEPQALGYWDKDTGWLRLYCDNRGVAPSCAARTDQQANNDTRRGIVGYRDPRNRAFVLYCDVKVYR
jgi:hypothetical protein